MDFRGEQIDARVLRLTHSARPAAGRIVGWRVDGFGTRRGRRSRCPGVELRAIDSFVLLSICGKMRNGQKRIPVAAGEMCNTQSDCQVLHETARAMVGQTY